MDRKMKYNINYSYTTYLAFLLNLRYNKTRKISIRKLKLFPKYLINLLIDKIDIRMITGFDDFEKFIIKHSDIFTVNDGYIYLNKNITVADLNLIVAKYNYPFTDFAIEEIKNNEFIKELLNLSGIRKKLEKYSEIEDIIEEAYMNDNVDNKTLKELYKKRNQFYNRLIKAGDQTVIDYEDEINYYLSDPFDEKNYPISNNNNIIRPNDDENLSFMLSNSFLIAYLTDEPLSLFRIFEDISNISLKFCFYESDFGQSDNPNEILKDIYNKYHTYTFRTQSELYFIITLIKELKNINLDILDDDGKYNIDITIKRLLYMVDNDFINLKNGKLFNYLHDNLKEIYKNYYNNDVFEIECSDIINYYGVVAKAFIFELFEGNSSYMLDDSAIKKLAFIKAYYNITKDKQILSLMSKYSENNNFWDYNTYIRNNNLKLERKK